MCLRDVAALASSAVLLVVSAACRPPANPMPPALSAPTPDRVGLSDEERQELYHLEEGSEVFPLPFFLALERKDSEELFSHGLERYGFLPDPVGPRNPYGLPVGITAATTRDLQFTGIEMVGVNCAACHVSELTFEGRNVRLDGAGGRANITAFYQGLAEAAQATFTDARKLLRFISRLRQARANEILPNDAANRSQRVFQALRKTAEIDPGQGLDPALYKQLLEVVEEESKRPAIDFARTLRLKPAAGVDPRIEINRRLTEAPTMRSRELRLPERILRNEARSDRPAADVRSDQRSLIGDIVSTTRLFKSRLEFLLRIAARMKVQGTEPGFGRIDAFGGARNLLFDGQQDSTAPVSYPHLWNFERLHWFHWDANTTSVLERNIGQALGLGAVINPTTFESTVSLVNLYRLEQLVRKIRPPRWEDTFGPVDANRASRGAALFESHCASCHAADPNDDQRIIALANIGTDPHRSNNFNAPVGNVANDRAIADFMGKVKHRAFLDKGLTPDQQQQVEGHRPSTWRLTNGYVARPLIAVWAAAPYLHNNAVPTLDDLLRPPPQRPTSFHTGSAAYDRVKVGYVVAAGPGTFAFDTTKAGNSNGGHPWGTTLSDTQRADLIEFLKRF
jgi:hypothetical protein